VHHSLGSGFARPQNYGGVVAIDDTFRFGFHTGDFNGDRRDDIVFQGRCGDDRHRCWRVLASQLNGTFAKQDWGDGIYPSPTETTDYGLLVGDFNGDGRDDIAYRGLCGAAAACTRVQLAQEDSTFVVARMSYGLYADGPYTPHFGLRVGDFNADGRADIAYRGRCGKVSAYAWRRHLSGLGNGFTISCSARLMP
jgi:hypothetical protein